MICPNCSNSIPEDSSFCVNCGSAVTAFQPPEGFTLDHNSGLYYNSVEGNDLTTGKNGMWVTWFYPNTGEYKQNFVPDEAAAAPTQSAHAFNAAPTQNAHAFNAAPQTPTARASNDSQSPKMSAAYANLTASAAWSGHSARPKKKLSPLVFIIPAAVLVLAGAVFALIYFGVLFGPEVDDPGDTPAVIDTPSLPDPVPDPDAGSGQSDDPPIVSPPVMQQLYININDSYYGGAEGTAISDRVQANSQDFFHQLVDAVNNSDEMSWAYSALPAWAQRDFGTADSLSLIPSWFVDYYDEPVLRVDYTILVYNFLLRMTGMDEVQLQNSVVEQSYFTDISEPSVLVCAGLGILNGYEDGTFRPYEPVTRQTAAVILSRLARIVGVQSSGHNINFNDIEGLWAEEDIRVISTMFDPFTGNTVMGGTGDNMFSPNGGFTRLQAALAMLRLSGVTTDYHISQAPQTRPEQANLREIDGSRIASAMMPEDMFESYLNTDWSFANGRSASVDAVMGNSPNNNFAFWFDVFLDSTGEVVLTTGVIPPGMEMAEIWLDAELPSGEYPATLVLHFIDYSGRDVGAAEIQIRIVIG